MLLTQGKQNTVRLWQKALFKNCQSHNRYLAVSQNGSKLDLGYLWNQPLLRTQKLNIQYAPSTLKLWQAVLVEVAYSTVVLVDERLGALLEAGAPPTSTLSLKFIVMGFWEFPRIYKKALGAYTNTDRHFQTSTSWLSALGIFSRCLICSSVVNGLDTVNVYNGGFCLNLLNVNGLDIVNILLDYIYCIYFFLYFL